MLVQSFEQDNPHAADFARLGVPVQAHNHHRLIFEDRLAALYRDLAQFRPTVVIANLGAMSFEVLRYLPRGVFRIGVTHADEAGVYDMLRHYAGVLDLMAVVSATIQKKMSALPEFSGVPVRYLPLGVPMPDEVSLPPREFTGPLRILYVGRLEQAQKRVQLFPAMLRQLQGAGFPFHWTIAGDGPERAALLAEMKCDQPGQTVSFPGHLSYAEIPALLRAHDLFLLASDYEGLPLSLLEAMGHGLVPVVSDLPSGIRELVDETNGFRIAPDDASAYMNAIIQIHHRRDTLQQLSRAAREKVRREFSVAAMADRWLGAMPVEPAVPINWPARINIQPILCAPKRWLFSPPARWLRRMLIKRQKLV